MEQGEREWEKEEEEEEEDVQAEEEEEEEGEAEATWDVDMALHDAPSRAEKAGAEAEVAAAGSAEQAEG